MFTSLLGDESFHELLLTIVRDLADTCRAEGCPACGGRLHSARYTRKPRGRACRLDAEHDKRFSFCCAVDGCRSRETPASLRFLGRRVYVAAIVVLMAILQHGATNARMERIAHVVNVDRRTVERWRTWWRRIFTATRFWQVARARFLPPVEHDSLPASLLQRFTVMPEACFQHGENAEQLVALLRFIGPITGGAGMQAR